MFVGRKNFILPALAVAGGVFLFISHPLWSGLKTGAPNAIEKKQEGPKTAPWLLEHRLLFQKSTLGTITGMAVVPAGKDSQPELVVAGQNGAAYFSVKGELRSPIKFEHKGYQMVPVGLKGERNFVFMNRGGDGQQVVLFDSQGRTVWQYGLGIDPIPSDMAAGDLGGDGELEFAVGMRGEGGIHLLDVHGKKKWRQPDANVWHAEILDVDGDGKNEIVHSNASRQVCIRDANGKLIREMTCNTSVLSFSLCRWPKTDGAWVLINNSRLEGIQLLDFSGKVLATFNPPAIGLRAFGTPVRLLATEKPYFALLVCDCVPNHDTRLYLYNPDGEIIFEKKYPTPQATLLTVPGQMSGSEDLLVGEKEGTVWQIRRKSVEPAQRN